MASARQPIHQPVAGPVVPGMLFDPNLTLVAGPARRGLIVGRMDNEQPVLFINAVSYRGLLDAASPADRVHETEHAAEIRAAAASLQKAWAADLKPPDAKDDRTYIGGPWPVQVNVLPRP